MIRERDEYIKIRKPGILLQGAALVLGSAIAGAGISALMRNNSYAQEPGTSPTPTLPTETLTPTESPIVIPTQSEDVTPQPTESISVNGEFEPVLATKINNEGEKISDEANLSLQEYGLSWTPDGHITYFTMPDGKKRYFISAEVSTWMIETPGQKSLKEYILAHELDQSAFREVLTPTGEFDDPNDYKNGYVGLTSVVQIEKDTNPMHLVATAHCEQRAGEDGDGTFTATVALFESLDGGQSWQDRGPIIRGRNPMQPGERVSGAGQPAAIVKDGYLQILYIEWATGADQIYGARLKIDNGQLGPVENITDENGELKPIITIPDGGIYSALPSVSFNQSMGKFLAIIETAEGFVYTTSTDLVNWDQANYILRYSEHNSAPRWEHLSGGQKFITYPTFLSEDKTTDQITGASGQLYFATRPFADNSHNLTSIGLTFTDN